ncbi:hypothetical protein Rsub_05906 [Raphidocelis subcapitata]|uniref:Uncharacterized protein n=1 Tax=Raphidocelis subcapitata TaxID=307507 RepID=A0A2V0NZW5_9CHLO|nr:hypothetical protein Rsub_05906 [Raphidocelis subcapitata]|eukprot:GBF93174.1 hypothetical protein Rsub_05906 [Raphidocelis subcapitata]
MALLSALRPSLRGLGGSGTTRGRAVLLATRATKDRVLRYPDGNVRHIRYPVADTVEDDDDGGGAWDVAGLPPGRARQQRQQQQLQRASSKPRAAGPAAAAPAPQQPAAAGTPGAAAAGAAPARPDAGARDAQPSTSGGGADGPSLSDTAAFLESLFSSSYAAAQPQINIDHCYKVLDGCPWLVPRPVYVLTLGDLRPGAAPSGPPAPGAPEGLVGSTYTLRTKVVQRSAAADLAALLGRPHLADALEVARLKDGVVAFETPDAAARYATRLEEEGETAVTVAEVDSHRLFRLASDSLALVVLVAEGEEGELPAPFQLAAALKGTRAWDDM